LSYYPFLPPDLNTLTTLEPLHGYWINMEQAGTLRYPATDQRRTTNDQPSSFVVRPSSFGVTPTYTWVNFYGPARLADGQPAPKGAVVQVFDADGVVCGAGVVTVPGQYGLLACYGDDPTTPEDEGASPGDALSFTIGGQPVSASQEAVWTAHGDLWLVPLGTARLWRLWLPLVEIGD